MKTSDLIKLLQEADPNDEGTVTVGNYPVWGVGCEPGYWDGDFWILLDKDGNELREEKYPSKMKKTGNGLKIVIDYFKPDSLILDKTKAKGIDIHDLFIIESSCADQKQKEEHEKRTWDYLNKKYEEALEFKKASDKSWIGETKKLLSKTKVYQIKKEDGRWEWHAEGEDGFMAGYQMIFADYPELFYYDEIDGNKREWHSK